MTRDTSFTRGPWIVNPFCARVDCETLSDKGGLLPVAQMLWPTDERSEAETEANAHLIAAAPELYAKVAIAATIFREYERLHAAKGNLDGDAKARRNAQYAEEMEAGLRQARGDSDR